MYLFIFVSQLHCLSVSLNPLVQYLLYIYDSVSLYPHILNSLYLLSLCFPVNPYLFQPLAPLTCVPVSIYLPKSLPLYIFVSLYLYLYLNL